MKKRLDRLYLFWLHFLRYAEWIELAGAKQSGNLNAVAFGRVRISQLDQQIDQISLSCAIN